MLLLLLMLRVVRQMCGGGRGVLNCLIAHDLGSSFSLGGVG